MLRMRHVGAALCGALVVGSCSNLAGDLPERDFIKKQWSDSIERLGFAAVYPPSEDVQVGDVYAVEELCLSEAVQADQAYGATATPTPTPRAVKITSLNLRNNLIAHYQKRYQFGPTAPPPATGQDYRKQPAQRGVYNTHHLFNVPLQALPEFELARGSVSRVAASIPLPFAGIFAAFAHRDSLTVSMKVPQSETYGLPAYESIGVLKGFCSSRSRPCNEALLRNTIDVAVQPFRGPTCQAHAMMVNRIFATRKIEYHYEFAEGTAVAAEVVVTAQRAIDMHKAATDLVTATKPQTNPAAMGGVIAASGDTVQAKRDALLTALLAQTTADLENLKASQAPGGSFSFARYGSNGIALTQTFERPIVIGYSGVRSGGTGSMQVQVLPTVISPMSAPLPRPPVAGSGSTTISPAIAPRPRPVDR